MIRADGRGAKAFSRMSNNIMTPNILGYYYNEREGLSVELSEGRGLVNQPIFGVTVEPDPGQQKSRHFQSRKEAEGYIEELGC